jgi:DNA (cytosine-5)-methyltransferase 1
MAKKSQSCPIPVIDLFAGPGGLGEGFSAANGGRSFNIAVSIEMEKHAHQTLTLRSFLRQFPRQKYPPLYFSLLQKCPNFSEIAVQLESIFPTEWQAAVSHAKQIELGPTKRDEVSQHLKELNIARKCVVIGGPPCQAYSLVGRAVRSELTKQGKYSKERDHRHFLYKEYLNILEQVEPMAFVMENVKGILTAEIGGAKIFDLILNDLKQPSSSNKKLRYRLFPLTRRTSYLPGFEPPARGRDFIINSEKHGIPQARHRVIVVGIREDLLSPGLALLLKERKPVSCWDAISDLPTLHSLLSKGKKNYDEWRDFIVQNSTHALLSSFDTKTRTAYTAALRHLGHGSSTARRGNNFIPRRWSNKAYLGKLHKSDLGKWLASTKLKGHLNHESRTHMGSDLLRYLFAASFAKAHGVSPHARDFPKNLWPAHKNFEESATSGGPFGDRFRVQIAGRQSTTITCHISKDGHGYIHPQPKQCRSLTAREAARLQTFPDDYFFCGPRTAQFVQIGNAVPPYLALQIAELISSALESSK